MSGGGAIDGMIKSFKSNRSLLKKRKHLKELYSEYRLDHYEKKEIKLKEVDPAKLKAALDKINKEYRNSIIRQILALIILAIIIFASIYYLMFT